MLADFLKALQTEVDNHSIYVWGGSGQLCCEVSEDRVLKSQYSYTVVVEKDETNNAIL